MELCPGRVLCSGLVCLSGYFSWLFFSGFFLKKLVSMLEENRSYPEILGFLAGTIGLFFFLSLFENWYEERLKPLADVDVYQGLYRRLYEKVCNCLLYTSELEQLFTLPEQPEMVIFVDDRMLCLGNSGVTSYDMAQRITLEKDAVLDEFCREKMGAKLNNSSDSYGGILFPGEDGACLLYTSRCV